MIIAPNQSQLNQCAKTLIDNNLTIAFAESATAGRLCAEFGLAEDAGKFLKGGITCYDATIKEKILKVDHLLIEKYTPESLEVTRAIAKGLQPLFDCDISIGCTGLACPGGSETEEKPVGTMFFHGYYKRKTIFSKRMVFSGDKHEIIVGAVDYLTMLLLEFFSVEPETHFHDDHQNKKTTYNKMSTDDGAEQWSVSWP